MSRCILRGLSFGLHLLIAGGFAANAFGQSGESNGKSRANVEAERAEADKKSRQMAAVPLGSPPSRRFNKDFNSWQELKERNVVMQKRDYSCGAAALSTMARYYFGDRFTEQEILELALKDLDARQLQDRYENGLSMDDLFNAAKQMNYQATVYRLEVKKLKDLEAPVIVRIIKNDYKHFVVLRGIVEDRVWLADPIQGNHRIPLADFLQQWNGVALIMGKDGFGLPKNHPLAVPNLEFTRPELRAAQRSIWLNPSQSRRQGQVP